MIFKAIHLCAYKLPMGRGTIDKRIYHQEGDNFLS